MLSELWWKHTSWSDGRRQTGVLDGEESLNTDVLWDIAGKSMRGLKAQLAQNLKPSFPGVFAPPWSKEAEEKDMQPLCLQETLWAPSQL